MDNQVLERKIPEKRKIFLCVKHNKAKKWTDDEDKLLLAIGEKFKFRNWKQIAKAFINRNGPQCYERYRIIKPEIKKGPWTAEEDQTLLNLIKIHGNKWSIISKIIKTRTGKQIRERYYNCLDQKINNAKFTEEENNLINCLFSKYGSAWSLIAKNLSGRTSQLIKNRFFCKINRRSINQKRKKPTCDKKQNTENDLSINENINSNFLSEESPYSSNLNNLINSKLKIVSQSIILHSKKQSTTQSKEGNLNKLSLRKNSLLRNKMSHGEITKIKPNYIENNYIDDKLLKTNSNTDEKNISNKKSDSIDYYINESFGLDIFFEQIFKNMTENNPNYYNDFLQNFYLGESSFSNNGDLDWLDWIKENMGS